MVSRNGKYACIYWPYHLMGLESPITILLGDLLGIGTHSECRQISVLTGIAREDLPVGCELWIAGHNHVIKELHPLLLELDAVGDAVPYYLLNGAILLNKVKKGDPITPKDLKFKNPEVYELYKKGLEL